MKTTNVIITIVGVLIVIGLFWLIYQNSKQEKIKQAAIKSGVSPAIATSIANSSNPAAAARSIGIPRNVADSIATGVAVSRTIYIDGNGNCSTIIGGTQQSTPCSGITVDDHLVYTNN